LFSVSLKLFNGAQGNFPLFILIKEIHVFDQKNNLQKEKEKRKKIRITKKTSSLIFVAFFSIFSLLGIKM